VCLFATFHIVYFYQQRMECIKNKRLKEKAVCFTTKAWCQNETQTLKSTHQNSTIAVHSKPPVLEFESNSNRYFSILKHHFQNRDKIIYLKQLILSLHFWICKATSLLLIQNIFLLHVSTTFLSGDVLRMLISGFGTSPKRKDNIYSHVCINWFQVLVS